MSFLIHLTTGTDTTGEDTTLVLTTEKRSLARAVALVAKENELPCTVVAEVKARAVRFKGF